MKQQRTFNIANLFYGNPTDLGRNSFNCLKFSTFNSLKQNLIHKKSQNQTKMLLIILLVIVFCITSVFSIVLLGDKQLISGNLYDIKNVLLLIFNWKFILSMTFAVITRFTFILINNAILKVPQLANASTTITMFVTFVSTIFIVIANHYYLNEKLNLQQGIGGFVMLIGGIIMFK